MARSAGSHVPQTAKLVVWFVSMQLLVLLAVGSGLILQEKWLKHPVLSVKGIAPSVSSGLYADMLRLELPLFATNDNGQYALTGDSVLAFLVQLLTDINPRYRHTLIAGVVPGIRDEAVPLKGQLGRIEAPLDYAPPPGLFERQNHAAVQSGSEGAGSRETGESTGGDQTAGTDANNGSLPDGREAGDSPAGDSPADEERQSGLDTGDRQVVFIYHTHNRESWVPELADKGVTRIGDAFDADVNITLVGERLAGQLEDLGIGASHSATDYFSEVKNYNWNFSYKYSEKTVETALGTNRDLRFLFDIHRDSQRRDITTVDIDGESYAQVYFIIGQRNPNWRENEAFAGKLHDAMERLKPGISRGIWGKDSGHGEYNQSVRDTSVLIEIGGPENTLEESYRTVDVLARAIAEVYWEAERVNADG